MIKTQITEDPPDMARQVAGRIRDLAAQATDGPATVALSGGSTPKLLFETMALPEFKDSMAWDKLLFFFGDERSVPPDHEDSNYHTAHQALLSKVEVKTHRMLVLEKDAAGYEQLVKDQVKKRRDGLPAFDLILLGMGPDGHTASLFPGTKALAEQSKLVVMNEVPQKQTWRMTFTYPLLNAADAVYVLLCGEGKRAMVADCIKADAEGDQEKVSEWPVLGVQPTTGELVWWLDKAAAGK